MRILRRDYLNNKMKYKKIMKRLLLLVSLVVAAATLPVNAQINLNKLGKQIKKSAEQQVEHKVKEKSAREVRNALESGEKKVDKAVKEGVSKSGKVGEYTTDESGYSDESYSDYSMENTDASPSIELDNVPADSYLNVPIGENVLEAYEKLDNNVYYNYGLYPKFFYKSAEESLQWLRMESTTLLMNAITAAEDEVPIIIIDDKDRPVPLGEFSINAYFALYNLFPKDLYPVFLEARSWLKVIREGKINENYRSTNVITARLKDTPGGKVEATYKPSDYSKYGYGFVEEMIFEKSGGTYTPAGRINRWSNEEKRLMDIYKENVSFENVLTVVINYFMQTAQATKDKNWNYAVYNSYLLDVAIEDLKNHPNKVENDDYHSAIQTYETWAANNFPKWRAEVSNQWKEFYANYKEETGGTVGIPKAAISNPQLEAEMIAVAKQIYDDGRVPVKAIIKFPDWNYTRNVLGGIIDRYHTAYIIFKMSDGSHRMVDIGFKQLYDGNSYGKTQLRGIGLLNEVVDYK